MDKNVSSFSRLELFIQYYLDRVTPYILPRWLFNFGLLILFCVRIFVYQGFYIIAYGLGIFLLNQLLLFLTPKQDPSVDLSNDNHEPSLPTKSTDEFRPFMRRLPEFKLWDTTFKSLTLSLILTCFSICDVPVFWPVLVIYFITLFLLTMRQRIAHMIKYRYLPFSYGKVRYPGKTSGQQGIKISSK